MPNDERILETMPDGALGLIPLKSCEELGAKVDQYLVGFVLMCIFSFLSPAY